MVFCCGTKNSVMPLEPDAPETKLLNSAFVFIKPHAVNDKTKELVAKYLAEKECKVVAQGTLTGEQIDERKLIDQHYYSIASKATILIPDKLNVPEDKFEAQFNCTWKDALATGRVMNAMDGCKALEIDAVQMDSCWAAAKKAGNMVKFGGGFYCALVEVDGKEPHYIFNGFFMAMRSKFTAPGSCIEYFVIEWDAQKLAWKDFRAKIIGSTDPTEADKDSLRGQIFANWEELGLKAEPNVGDNGVHASASPFEGLAERANWVGAEIEKDCFGAPLIAAGLTVETIRAWCIDPQVTVDGSPGSVFDALEDTDANDCRNKLVAMNAQNK